MSHKDINLRIPSGVTWLRISYHDELTEKEEHDAIRDAFAEAEKHGAATTTLAHEEVTTAFNTVVQTGLDILRMRGTPLELIGSAIVAEDWKTANAAFRTSILEYVYEKIAAFSGANIAFMNSRDLGTPVKHDGSPIVTIGLTSEHDTQVHRNSALLHVCKVESGESREGIDDAINASVMGIIERITGDIIAAITTPLDRVLTEREGGTLEMRIVVDLFEHELKVTPKELIAHANVPMVAWWHG